VVHTARTEAWYRAQAERVEQCTDFSDPLRPYTLLMPHAAWETSGSSGPGVDAGVGSLMTPASFTPLVWPRLLAAITAPVVLWRGGVAASPDALSPPAVYLELASATLRAHPDLLARGVPTAAVVASLGALLSRPRGLVPEVAAAALRLLLVVCDIANAGGGLGQPSAACSSGISTAEHGGGATLCRMPAAGSYTVTVAVDSEVASGLLPQALAFADSQDETDASAAVPLQVPVELTPQPGETVPAGPMPSADEPGEWSIRRCSG
jgi:hypothetical protein